MLRLSLIVILTTGCTRYVAQPTTPAPQPAAVDAPKPAEKPAPPLEPKNFVCSRLAAEGNTKATCEPEITEPDMHRAVITIDGGRASCALPAGALSVVCGPLFYTQERSTDAIGTSDPPRKLGKIHAQSAPKADPKKK